MPNVMQYTFRLFGPNKGKTMVVAGHQFFDGQCRLTGEPQAMGFVQKVLGYYAAYAMGTAEYDAAMAREKEEEAARVAAEPEDEPNGASEVPEDAGGRQADADEGDLRPDGEESPEEAADGGERDDGAEAGDTGVLSGGDGHEDAGVPRFEDPDAVTPPSEPRGDADADIRAAVMKLDPENDEHWTGAGLPKVDAVDNARGRAGTTRKDVEAACPGYNRDKAVERMLENI